MPRIIASTINFGGGGKVAIIDYGRVGSDYHASITRKYAIPPDWDEAQVAEHELEVLAKLKSQVDPVLDAEFTERWDQKMWDGDSND